MLCGCCVKLSLTISSNRPFLLGLNIQGWEDAFYVGQKTPHNRETFPPTIELITNTWKNVWEFGTSHHLYELANSGYKVYSYTHLT